MKVLTEEEENDHYRYTLKHGLRGGAVGLGAGLGLSLVAQRYSQSYRNLPLSLKAFFVTSVSTGVLIVVAEQASHRYEKEKYGKFNEQNREVNHLSALGAAKEFMTRNKWSIICGSWAMAMVGSMASLYRNKYLTTPQKLVQARMYAQGLTILIALASVGLTFNNEKKESIASQEWKAMVAEEERRMNRVSSSR